VPLRLVEPRRDAPVLLAARRGILSADDLFLEQRRHAAWRV